MNTSKPSPYIVPSNAIAIVRIHEFGSGVNFSPRHQFVIYNRDLPPTYVVSDTLEESERLERWYRDNLRNYLATKPQPTMWQRAKRWFESFQAGRSIKASAKQVERERRAGMEAARPKLEAAAAFVAE